MFSVMFMNKLEFDNKNYKFMKCQDKRDLLKVLLYIVLNYSADISSELDVYKIRVLDIENNKVLNLNEIFKLYEDDVKLYSGLCILYEFCECFS